MAVNTLTQQSYNPYQGSVLGTSTPVAAGPVPTPVPPSGVVYTPQYSGSSTFSTPNPTTYTSTPQGAAELAAMYQSTNTSPSKITTQATTPVPTTNVQSETNQALIDEYMRRGWTDINSIKNDIAAGGYKSWYTGGGSTDKTVSKTGDPRAMAVLNDPTANQDFQNSGMNIDDYLAQIDKESGNTMNFLQQQEEALRADQPGIESNITNQANLARQRALSTKEDAQSAARRLYSELQQGYRQRFGGASSAGEAATALTNAEQQRVMAQNNRTYQDAVAQVDLSAAQSIQSAQSEFRNALLTINQNRVATENERLAARRQALSDLSNKVFQIQQQREAFKQNLALMQEQARLQNEANLSSFSTNPTSTLTTNNTAATASGNAGISSAIGAIGNVSSGIAKNDELTAKGIYPIQSMADGRIKYSDGIIR